MRVPLHVLEQSNAGDHPLGLVLLWTLGEPSWIPWLRAMGYCVVIVIVLILLRKAELG